MFTDNLFLVMCYVSVFCLLFGVSAGVSDWYYNRQPKGMARWKR